MKNKYVIWFSENMIRIGKSIWKKPEIKRTKELEDSLQEARCDLFSTKEIDLIMQR